MYFSQLPSHPGLGVAGGCWNPGIIFLTERGSGMGKATGVCCQGGCFPSLVLRSLDDRGGVGGEL